MVSHTATDLYSTWVSTEHGHTTQFFDDIHVMRQQRGGPPAFVTVVSTVRALSRLTTSSMPNKCARRHAQCEQARTTVHLPSSGSLLLAQTVLNATTNRHAAPVVRMARTRHSSERAHTSVPRENDPRKAAAAPPAPTWRSDPGANDACDTPRATTQIYCRRARASTTTPVPKDPYHSRKMTTRGCDFRHKPSAGCTYSSSAVLRATGMGGQLRTCNQGATQSRKSQYE
eukprot:7379989-Prymnesium_polylepis.1